MPASALQRLSEASGREFPNLLKARERTRDGLERRRHALSDLVVDDDAPIVLMGSWGSAEVTGESDDDFMVLVRGQERTDVHPAIADVQSVLDRSAGDQGIFGQPVSSTRLIERGELGEVTRDTASGSHAFKEAARLGKELERGLLALLFEADDLGRLARDYVVF